MKPRVKRMVLAMVLSLMLVVGLFPISIFAAGSVPEGIWTNYAAENFAGGTGAKDDPYQIATAEQLAKLAKDTNDDPELYYNVYFQLTDNIDLSTHRWIPIGMRLWTTGLHVSFQGYLDGNSKIISGLYVDESANGHYAGLFGSIIKATNSDDYAIKNLTIQEAYIKTSNAGQKGDQQTSYAGILVGFCTVNNGPASFDNINVSGTIEAPTSVGGMAGISIGATYRNCTSDVTIISDKGVIGGFVGEAQSGSYINCTSKGSINGGWAVGGFAGIMSWSGNENTVGPRVDHCASQTAVSAWDWNTGGFAGWIEGMKDTQISNCYAYGDVENTITGDRPKTGGFVGTSSSTTVIANSHFSGKVTTQHAIISAGGFVGYDEGGNISKSSFDNALNPNIESVGESLTPGTNDIEAAPTQKVLSNICEDYYNGHDYSTDWTVDKEPTCGEVGSKSHHCTRCAEKLDITEIPTLSHNAKKIEAKAATATENGNIVYWYCPVCGKYFSNDDLTKEITLEDTIIWAIDSSKPSSPSAPSNKLDGTTNPVTGDSSNSFSWIILMFAAGIALTGAIIYTKKRKVQ